MRPACTGQKRQAPEGATFLESLVFTFGDRCGEPATWKVQGRPLCDACKAIEIERLQSKDTILAIIRGRAFTKAEAEACARPIQ